MTGARRVPRWSVWPCLALCAAALYAGQQEPRVTGHHWFEIHRVFLDARRQGKSPDRWALYGHGPDGAQTLHLGGTRPGGLRAGERVCIATLRRLLLWTGHRVAPPEACA